MKGMSWRARKVGHEAADASGSRPRSPGYRKRRRPARCANWASSFCFVVPTRAAKTRRMAIIVRELTTIIRVDALHPGNDMGGDRGAEHQEGVAAGREQEGDLRSRPARRV